MAWLGVPAVKENPKQSNLIGNKQDKSVINCTSLMSLQRIFCWQVKLGRTAVLPPSFVFSITCSIVALQSLAPARV